MGSRGVGKREVRMRGGEEVCGRRAGVWERGRGAGRGARGDGRGGGG